MVDDMGWQNVTPELGIDTPALIIDAGLESVFLDSVQISRGLHKTIATKYTDNEAQYACLLGHKLRWKLTLNARAAYHFLELRTSPQGHPGYRLLCQAMHKVIAEVHPLIAGGMKYVDHSSSAELTRLAAEQASAKKQASA
jgi:thymidylate synthase ThyX